MLCQKYKPDSLRGSGVPISGKRQLLVNRVWQSLATRASAIQRKLTVSQANDPQEREADRVADQVMRAATPQSSDSSAGVLQRKCECGGGQCDGCRNQSAALEPVPTKRAGPVDSSKPAAPSIVHEALRSSAQPLDAATRHFMESRLGEDLSGVRVHTNTEAAQAAEAVSARAYTVGQNVVFGSGEYAPTTSPGRTLLAHELTHVIQQRGSNSSDRGSSVIQRDDDKKSKPTPATIDSVDDLYGPLTEDLAKQAFTAYGGALVGNEKAVIAAFKAEGFSGWMGLAIIKQESSFANKANNPDIDERNVANPFSVHFNTSLKAWPKGCGKNLLLIAEAGKNYTPSKDVKKECAAKDFRLPTFAESATASAKTMGKLAKKKEGIDAYREEPGYKKDLNTMLNEILNKIKAKRK
jgi:hypothetical protein